MGGRLTVPELGCVAVGLLAGVLIAVGGFARLLAPLAAIYPVAGALAWLAATRGGDRDRLGLRRGLVVAAATLAVTVPLMRLPWIVGGGLPAVDLPWARLLVAHLQFVAPVTLLFALGAAESRRDRAVVVGLLALVLGAVLVRQVATGWWAAPRYMWPDLLETVALYGVAAALGLPMVPLARHLPAIARERAQGVSGATE